MTRKTKVRIVGDPTLASRIEACLKEHFECTSQRFNRTPYRYAKTPGITIYLDIKREKEVEAQFVKQTLEKLIAYLDIIIPELEKYEFSDRLELTDGVNVMDLSGMRLETQQLVIASTIEYAFQHLSGVVVVIPEAWEMIPQFRMTPVKWVAEQFIRKGAAIGNYLWLDSQDIGGIDKTPLRQCDNWLMGRMKEAHEVERILKQLLGLKIGKEEIQRLPLGHFYAAIGDSVHKVYVLPAGVPEEVGRKVALGEFSPEYVRDKFLKLRLLEGEELVWKQKYEEIKKQLAELTQEKMRIEAAAQKIRQKNIDLIYKVERLQEQLREKEAPQEVTKLRNRVSFLEAKNKDLTKRLERLEADLKLFSEFKSVLRRMGFGPTPTTAKLTTEMLGEVTVATEQPEYRLRITPDQAREKGLLKEVEA